VVSEHGDDRHLELAARIGNDADFVQLAVLCEVAGEEDQVGLFLDAPESLGDAVSLRRARVDVACSGYPDQPRHGRLLPQEWNGHSRVPIESVADDTAFENLLRALRTAAAVLRDNDIDVALAGGFAVYARGGPPTEHDVDFVVRAEEAERAVELLEQAGFRAERPPEGWLFKVFDENDAMIDLIFAPNSKPEVVPDILARSEPLEIYAITMNVMGVTDVLATKLLTLKEHEVDYESVLEITRSCREQVDWDLLRRQTEQSPYAKAFFTLAEELGLAA
jgi:Uncharacterised nucleotidyltransferase